MQQQSDESGGAGAGAVIGEQGVLQFVFANDVLGELDVKFIFGPKDLNVLCNIRRKIFDRPRTQYRVFILQARRMCQQKATEAIKSDFQNTVLKASKEGPCDPIGFYFIGL